jgi:acetyltransferase-like isoleucine patch superfamily enzyme
MKFNQINIIISPNAKIGKNVKIGDNTTIYDNVTIGDNSIIANNCIIGEPTQDYYENENYENKPCIIGSNALIRSHSIIYSNNIIGNYFSTGHRVTIREGMTIGNNCRVGTLSDFQGHSTIGNFCWFHSNVHIGQQSKIGNFVFIYPYVVLTNDPHPPSNICIGPTIEDFAQIAVGAVILPAIHIGKHALVAAQAVVGKNVNEYELVAGNPAKMLKDVRELKSRETGKSHYPWVYNFERGMPWENLGYDNWRKQTDTM